MIRYHDFRPGCIPSFGFSDEMVSPSVRSTPGRQTPGLSRFGASQRSSEVSNGHNVRVVARVRPFLEPEMLSGGSLGQNYTAILKGIAEDTVTISNGLGSRSEEYKLDACYGESCSNAVLFANEVQPILQCLLDGVNATVFAYGATGSGKTHTMQGTEEDPGLMFRAVSNILSDTRYHACLIAVSYYEVYMDRCYDLLETKREVSVLEDSTGSIQFRGLSKVNVKSTEEFAQLLADGCARRKFGTTAMNDASSRSHGVLVVHVTSREGTTGDRNEAKLNLIDLAGNEDNRKTGNEGVRLAESSHINQSLFALSNVINALNANDGVRVPYRDSKLTRILRDSLGGTYRSVMVACLNPGSYGEATRTLSLAARSRQIINHTETSRCADTACKSDMHAKLQAWKEAKKRTPVKSTSAAAPSPSPNKPVQLKSPSQINRTPKVSSVNKNLAERSGNKIRLENSSKVNIRPLDKKHGEQGEEKVKVTASEPKKTKNSGVPSPFISMSSPSSPFKEVLFSTNPLFQHEDTTSETCESEADKENDFLQLIGSPYTPLDYKSKTVDSSPPFSARLKGLTDQLRCLSPIATNVSPLAERVPEDLSQTLDLSFSTPNGKLVVVQASERSPDTMPSGTQNLEQSPIPVQSSVIFEDNGTPYEKFTASTSKMRTVWVEQYLDVLNTASREELLLLKGFGARRTDAILELRQKSPKPIKQIKDLERIGVSIKQAYTMLFGHVHRSLLYGP